MPKIRNNLFNTPKRQGFTPLKKLASRNTTKHRLQILAKALTNRLYKIIGKLINTDQVEYIKKMIYRWKYQVNVRHYVIYNRRQARCNFIPNRLWKGLWFDWMAISIQYTKIYNFGNHFYLMDKTFIFRHQILCGK